MVKVFAPMFSLDATGTIGNAVTFSKWKGRNYVRERVIPSNPKSGAQVGRRAMFAFLAQQWTNVSVSNKATWQDIADQIVAAPFNGFMKDNMENWHNFLTPAEAYPPTRTGTPAVTPTGSTATWEENRIKNQVTLVTANDAWGIILFASLSTGFTPAVGTAYQVQIFNSPQAYDYYWTPPSVATWYFRNLVFTVEGKEGTLEAEYSAVP